MTSANAAIAATKDYLRGRKIRAEIKLLSTDALSKKFERAPRTIRAIARGGKPGYVPESELNLISECTKERQRLEGIARGLTLDALAGKYHVSDKTIREYAKDFEGLE